MNSSKKKSARVIKNFHGMPWLKKHSPTNSQAQRAVGPDEEVLSTKKTDEDYFPGTRDKKRGKKKKVKKEKTVFTLDTLVDLMSPAPVSPDLEEETNPCSNSPNGDDNISQTVPGAAVWSKDESTADRLFPNVQSVVIDRNDEAEMLTEALAESVATLQLESFKKPTILEENQWEAERVEDEGWENVRRNLPSPLKHDPPSSNDEDNTSPRPGILRNKQNNFKRCFTQPESLNFEFRRLSESLKEEIKAGRSLKSVSFSETLLVEGPSGISSRNDESEKIVDGGKAREPNIDKYGRVDGYSERRLFMGKGARMKELQYIESKNNVAAQDNKQPESEALVAMQPLQDVLKSEEGLTTAMEEPTNSVHNPEKPFTEVETPLTVLENPEVENPEKPTTKVEIKRLEETDQPTSEVEQQEKLDVVKTEVKNREPNEPEMELQELQQPEPAIIETLVTPPPVQDICGPEEEPMPAVETRRATELEISTSEAEVAGKPIPVMEIPESKEPEAATISENRTHRLMETKVTIPPAPVQDFCQLTGMPMIKVETSENQTHPTRESDFDAELIIQPGVQDVRYMKKDPSTVVEAPNRRRTEKSNTRMWLEPQKQEMANKLKMRVGNQTKKSRANSKESFVSLQSKTTAPETTESKVKSMKTKNETVCEEPATRLQIVINNRQVEMVSRGTQTEGNCKPGNETSLRDILPSQKISEKKSDFVGRSLVPTLVMDDTLEEDSTLDLKTLSALDAMPEPQFQSAAWQNLMLTGAAVQDASYEAQNSHMNAQYLQNQNNFVPNPVPLNSRTIAYLSFNNGMPMPNYSRTLPLPNYLNGNLQFPPTGCGYSLANLPCENGDGLGNLNFVVYKPVETREDLLERENNNHAVCQLKSDYERQALGAVAPGFVKSSQLPPGFTKKEGKTDNGDLRIVSSESNLKNVENTRVEVHQGDYSPSQITDDRRGPRKKNNHKRSHNQRNWKHDVRESETGSDLRDSKRKPFSQTKMEYQQRQNLWHQRKLAELRARQNSGSLKNATEEKSLILEEKSNANSLNNNYLTESVNSLVDRQANFPQSKMPVVYQMPDQQSPGIGLPTNWQYNANVMNAAQIPVKMVPGYQCLPLIPNPHTLASESYNPMTYQQLQSPLFNPIQAARNSASDVSPQNGYPANNNHSVEMVRTGLLGSQQYSAAGNNHSDQIPTKSVRKAPKGRRHGKPT